MNPSVYSALLANKHSNSPALLGVDRRPLTHRELCELLEASVNRLNALGIGRGDRVGIVLPNGPETAALCLSVAACAACAPLSPDSTAEEFDRFLDSIRPKAIIAPAGKTSACIDAAQRRGVPILCLAPDINGPAGSFSLFGDPVGEAARPGMAEYDEVALLVHTSGSMSRPKLAPLTHGNLCHGARGNIEQLQLTARDRCLCLTAMFFTQGLLVSVFSSLVAGGSVVCTPGFGPDEFFSWLAAFDPTWYAAPVAMQRSILLHAAKYPDVVTRSHLRVIRSSSSAASPDFIAQIENLFRAPMLDSYGLTETSSTIVGERLPPAARKPGSVGLPVGCEIGVVDSDGNRLGPGEVGEVVVRGGGVVSAYEGGDEVNAQSFVNGWLRTGDLGTIDEDGFLFLQGRSKEIINRGGLKILPAEIDEVLNRHPAVAEGIAFAFPHEMLGEEVGAAVALRDGKQVGEQTLREFCAVHLSLAKVPRKIVFVDKLPKTATGKSIRIGLAQKLGLSSPTSKETFGHANGLSAASRKQEAPIPVDIIEMVLLGIWEEVLEQRPIGIHDDFFALGGDSLKATVLLTSVFEVFGVDPGPAALLVSPTVAGMASRLLDLGVSGLSLSGSKIIPIQSSGAKPPIFIIGAQPLYRALILDVPKDIPLYALGYPDARTLRDDVRLEDIAAMQVETLLRFRPKGPCVLMGWCVDGVLAYEIAQQLAAQGHPVNLVAMIDAFNPTLRRRGGRWHAYQQRLRFHFRNLAQLDGKSSIAYCRERLQTVDRKIRQRLWRVLHSLHLRRDRRSGARSWAFEQILPLANGRYVPKPYDGAVMLVRAGSRPEGRFADAAHGWRHLTKNLRVVDVAANHRDIFIEPHACQMAAALIDSLPKSSPVEASLVTCSQPGRSPAAVPCFD